MLDGSERGVIERFATSEPELRDEAIRIHRNQIAWRRARGLPLPHGDIHFDFMSEIDNPCPDLILRAMYREKLRLIMQSKERLRE